MPLSEHEQRLFEQIERSLAEDPKFASAVRSTDPRFHARMSGEGPLAELIADLFALACRKAGIHGQRPELSTAAFRRPPGLGWP